MLFCAVVGFYVANIAHLIIQVFSGLTRSGIEQIIAGLAQTLNPFKSYFSKAGMKRAIFGNAMRIAAQTQRAIRNGHIPLNTVGSGIFEIPATT